MPRKPKPTPPAAETPHDARPRWLEYLPLPSIQKAAENPKRHAESLGESLEAHGYVSPIVLDERTGRLVAGGGRVDALVAAHAAGKAPPEGIRLDGETWLVPVYRGWRSKDDTQARLYLLADNRVSAAGGWDDDELAAMVAELSRDGVDLGTAGFSDADVEGILAAAMGDAGPVRDWSKKGRSAPPTVDEVITVREGQLYRIGPHRLLVGDSTRDDVIDRLMGGEQAAMVATDPPYAIFGSSTGVSSEVADDSMVRPFFAAIFRQIGRVLPWFGHLYLCCDWRSWASIWDAAKAADVTAKNMLVWDKGSGLGSSYMNAHELVFFGARLFEQRSAWLDRAAKQRTVHRPNMLRMPALGELLPAELVAQLSPEVRKLVARLATVAPLDVVELVVALALDPKGDPRAVLKVARANVDERTHNAAKPVPLFAELIENSSDAGALVFEPFLGSGTTIIAAEQTGRRCYAVELKPKTAQRALARIQAETGLHAELVE